ncbi:MAG: hypothetical protein EAZ95_00240 [Bacteroidetes bacterium]|nr:MAG: hypothetical protein EAZ95_00240 [Bacteroidota bacterium]
MRKTQEVYNQQPIYYRNYFCWLRAEVEYYAMQKALPTNFGQSLMACDVSPPLGYEGSEEKTASIQIFSNADYDNALPAGSDLASIFQIRANNTQSSYLAWYESGGYKTLPAFLATNPPAFYDAYLRLSEAPTLAKKHIFRIEYKLTNGEQYSIQTPEITFQ